MKYQPHSFIFSARFWKKTPISMRNTHRNTFIVTYDVSQTFQYPPFFHTFLIDFQYNMYQ